MARILYIFQKDFPWDVRVEKICRSLHDAGHTVCLLARWNPEYSRPASENWQGLTVKRVGYQETSWRSLPVSGNPFWAKALKTTIEQFQPDVVIAREIMLAEAAATAAHRTNIPLIIDMAENYPAAMRGWKKYNRTFASRFAMHTLRVPDLVERRAVLRADGIITVCDENSERLLQQYHYPLSQTQVVHNTPDLMTYHGVHKGSSQPAGEPPRQFGFHGYMMPERNLEMLVRGFTIAARFYPDIHLILAGSGESLPDVRCVARNSPTAEQIHIPGGYSSGDWVRLFSATDIGLVLYRDDDFSNFTLPNKLFDYLACGKPVIVTDVRPMKRIVEETGAGIAINTSRPEPIAEAITQIRSMDYQQLSTNALQAAHKRYNWGIDASMLLQFVRQFY